MKVSFVSILLFFFLFTITVTAQKAKPDTTVKTPDYTNVKVEVETEWGVSSKTESVDLFIKRKPGKPIEIVANHGDHHECTIVLIKGVSVSIYDGKTGKLLKKLQGSE
jgi:predicted metal-dependent RNase